MSRFWFWASITEFTRLFWIWALSAQARFGEGWNTPSPSLLCLFNGLWAAAQHILHHSIFLFQFNPSTAVILLQGYFSALHSRIFLRPWDHPDCHTFRHLGVAFVLFAPDHHHPKQKYCASGGENIFWKFRMISQALKKLHSAFKQWKVFGDEGVLPHTTGPKPPVTSYLTWGISTAVLGRSLLRLPGVPKRM